MKAIDEFIEWMEERPPSNVKDEYYIVVTHQYKTILAKARELRDAERKEPPYDREAFRRELIIEAYSKIEDTDFTFSECAKMVNNQADAIIAEYERRQGNG
jgi:hypothetical protein